MSIAFNISFLQTAKFRELPLGLRVSLVMLSLIATLPFLQPIHHLPIPSFYEEWWSILLGVLAILAVLSSNLPRIALPSVALIPGILCIAAFIQLILGKVETPQLGIFYCGFTAWAVVMTCLGATLAEHLGRARLFRLLATALLAGALISAVLAFAQRMEIRLPYQLALRSMNGSIYANLGQPNLLVTYLWIGIASLIYLHERTAVSSILTAAGILLLGAAAGLTGARIAYLHGCGLILLSFLLYRNGKINAPPAQRWPYLLVGLAAIFMAGEISRLLPWTFSTETTALSRLRTGLASGDARFDIWRDTLTLIVDHPWAGNGVGNFSWRIFEAAAAAPDGATTFPGTENAHNGLLQIGADFGIPILILIVFLGVRWLIRFLSKKTEPAEEYAINMVTLLAIHSQLEFPLWYAYYLGLCALMLGAIDPHLRMLDTLRKRILQIAFVIAIVALIPLRLDYGTLDDTMIVRAALRNSKEDWQRRMNILAELEQTSILSPYANMTLGVLLTPDRKLASEQSIVCERTMHIRPEPVVITHCAVLRQLTGREAEAHELLTRVQRAFRHPAQLADINEALELSIQKNPEIRSLGIPVKEKD